MTEALFYSAIYTAKSKKVALVIGYWECVIGHLHGRMEECKMIYLTDHQTKVSQCPK